MSTSPDTSRLWQAPDGARIAYRLHRAPQSRGILVLLHGVASNHTRWNEYAAHSALRERFDLLRIDRRGQGGSVWRGPITLEMWCDDIAGLAAFLGHPRAVVGGHCLGANIAIAFAARHPDRTAGLVLVEPMPPGALAGTMRSTARLRPLFLVLERLARGANAIGIRRRQLPSLDLEALDRTTREALAKGPAGESLLDQYASPFLDLKTTPTAAYFRDLLAVTGSLPPFESITAPVLALLSRHSTMTDPERTRAALGRFPDIEIEVLEAEHWIPTEQPEGMRAAIDGWIDRRVPRPA